MRFALFASSFSYMYTAIAFAAILAKSPNGLSGNNLAANSSLSAILNSCLGRMSFSFYTMHARPLLYLGRQC